MLLILRQMNMKRAEAEAERLALAIKRDWRERERIQEVPARPRNYFSYVCDSKEVLKVMNLFTSGLTTIKQVRKCILLVYFKLLYLGSEWHMYLF